jgi:uncharacterized protein YegL
VRRNYSHKKARKIIISILCRISPLSLAARTVLLKMKIYGLFMVLSVCFCACSEDRFDDVRATLESILFDFAREIVRRHDEERCNVDMLRSSERSNYDACVSTHPSQVCTRTASFGGAGPMGQCGCGFLYDHNNTVNMIPGDFMDGKDGNPTDLRLIESISMTTGMEDFFVAQRDQHKAFWEEIGFEPTYSYFGSATGLFRQYPGQYQTTCGNYDCRLRKWYVGGSSGPKNIVLVLDTSKSMEGEPLRILIEAAKRVVNTLSVADRVAIISFGTEAHLIGDGSLLYEANKENVGLILDHIIGLRADGLTNFYEAFQTAFSVLEDSEGAGKAVDCNSGILFFTDGELNTGDPSITHQTVLNLVETKLAERKNISHPTLLMTYVVGSDTSVQELPRQLACLHEYGVFSIIDDFDDVIDSLSSYYKLFAFGLRTGSNEGFVSWVGPYEFAQSGLVGTTASLPVYSKVSGLFIGVVAIDILIDAFNKAIGGNTDESIRRIARQSIAKCPSLSFTLCELESYRLQSSGKTCTAICNDTDLVDIDELRCPIDPASYPSYLWVDNNSKEVPYEGKGFCPDCSTEPTSDPGAPTESPTDDLLSSHESP